MKNKCKTSTRLSNELFYSIFFISKSGDIIYIPYKYITNISLSSRIMHNMLRYAYHQTVGVFCIGQQNISVTMKINNGSQESSKPLVI